jgi:hypothetical protein
MMFARCAIRQQRKTQLSQGVVVDELIEVEL